MNSKYVGLAVPHFSQYWNIKKNTSNEVPITCPICANFSLEHPSWYKGCLQFSTKFQFRKTYANVNATPKSKISANESRKKCILKLLKVIHLPPNQILLKLTYLLQLNSFAGFLNLQDLSVRLVKFNYKLKKTECNPFFRIFPQTQMCPRTQ